MTFAEIMKLKDSGFTPEQIMTLTTSDGAIPSAPPEDTGVELTTNIPEVESPAEVGEGTPSSPTEGEKPDAFQELRDMINGMRDEYKELRDLIQGNNIRDKSVPTVRNTPDAADIMKQIIRPDIKERS